MKLKNVLGEIKADYGRMHVDDSPPCCLWQQFGTRDAVESGRRPQQHHPARGAEQMTALQTAILQYETAQAYGTYFCCSSACNWLGT